jgi:hypothetical protein
VQAKGGGGVSPERAGGVHYPGGDAHDGSGPAEPDILALTGGNSELISKHIAVYAKVGEQLSHQVALDCTDRGILLNHVLGWYRKVVAQLSDHSRGADGRVSDAEGKCLEVVARLEKAEEALKARNREFAALDDKTKMELKAYMDKERYLGQLKESVSSLQVEASQNAASLNDAEDKVVFLDKRNVRCVPTSPSVSPLLCVSLSAFLSASLLSPALSLAFFLSFFLCLLALTNPAPAPPPPPPPPPSVSRSS